MAERYDFYVHDNRKITFNLTEPIMREDSGVTDFVFHIPKILNELEVSDWQWWLVFVNAKKEKYSIALTLSDDPESPLENNLATYTVDYAMSIKAGAVQFALEAINASTGGVIDNEWHTQSYEIKVKETLQGNQAEYAETESDIISALIQEVRTKMNQIIGGATPTPVNLKSLMTDPQKVYLYVGSEPNEHAGHWYYHNGTTFVSGGVYGAGVVDAVPTQGSTNAVSSGGVYDALDTLQAQIPQIDSTLTQSGQAADSKVVGDEIEEVKSDLNDIYEFGENLIHLVENVPYDTTSSYWYKKATSILSTNKKYVLKIIFDASATARTIQAGTRSNSDYMVDTIYSGEVVANEPVYVYDYVPSTADIRYFRSSANVAWTLYLYEVIVTDGIVDSLQDATEKLNTFGRIVNEENLFVGAHFVKNKYYYAGAGNNENYSYFEVNVESGKSYIFGSNVYFISSASTGISNSTLLAGTPYTAQATEKQYFTVLNDHRSKWAMCESTVDVATVGTYDAPTLSVNILKQKSGTGKSQVMSQKATTDAIANATHDILPTNIDGITIKDGTDLLILAEVTDGKYAYVQNNTLKWGTSASYKTYKIPAKQGTYTCVGGANFVIPVTANDTPLDYVDSLTLTIACPALTEYLYLSVSSAHWEEFKIGYGTTTPTSTKYDFPMLYVNDASTIENKIYGKGYARVTGALSNGESFTLARTNVKKNNVFSFLGKITNFSSIIIGHGKNAYDSCYLVIDGTKITRHNYTSTDDVREYTHGLTIDDYIYVEIQVGVGLAKVIVYSNQQTYTINETTWSGDGNADIFVESNGSTLTDCVFTWSSADFRKSVWMFGDSYFSMMAASRWTYYLNQYGFIDNVLLNAYPGEATSGALTALGNALTYYGKPKYLLWCLGMNDGADSNENTPSASWMNGVNAVLGYCNQYGIIPILATIPSVPTLYHGGKNKWVRTSGYRYIDFAKAVGATDAGVWYDGMLSDDGIHPAVSGAIALYFEAIADVPEITFTNP